ncbi:MAG: ABC transporter substrate-binding protein [Clostridia bacterium]|nr:ABC transporter substrate-binding protein [Clostridia bacterium]
MKGSSGRGPRRVVALCPSNAELALRLGAADRLVGVDRWSLRDPRLRLPKGLVDVGTDLRADVETIAALKPDLVLASLSVPGMEANVEAFRARGIPHVVVPSGRLADIRRAVWVVAEALGDDEARSRAERIVAGMDAACEEVRARAAAWRRAGFAARTAVWEWWPKPIVVAGQAGWPEDLMACLGLRNAFSDLERESGPVEAQLVAERAPDVVFAAWCGTGERRMTVAEIAGRPGWGRVPAVRERRVFLLPENPFGRPSPGLADGLRRLADLLFGPPDVSRRVMLEFAEEAGLGPDALAWPEGGARGRNADAAAPPRAGAGGGAVRGSA